MASDGLKEFHQNTMAGKDTEMKEAFDKDGGIIVRGMLDKEELEKVRTFIESDTFQKHKYVLYADADSPPLNSMLWKKPGNDITGMVTRSQKVAGTTEMLLGGEAFLYHGKVIMKDASGGGPFLWHQDYGYWYQNMILRPDMLTVWIALDPAKKENGCLQILKGTHHCGRIDHTARSREKTDKLAQLWADPERVKEIEKHFQNVHAELEPGDSVIFHGNVLHCSGTNTSPNRRWGLVMGFNRADNDTPYEHYSANYNPLHKVENSAIRECTCTDVEDKEFVQPQGYSKWDETTK